MKWKIENRWYFDSFKGKEMKKTEKCRCYINAKYYARVAKTGKGTFQGYKPCPIHEKENEQ